MKMPAIDPGCVKTRLNEGRAELFSQLPSSDRSCQCIGCCIDEIETEILHASWASEFSHSLDPKQALAASKGIKLEPAFDSLQSTRDDFICSG